MKLILMFPLLGYLFALQSVPAMAQNDVATFALSAGAEFTSGTYGGDVDIEDTYVPITAAVNYDHIGFRLTLPYLSVTAPAGTIFDSAGEPLPGSGALTTENGLGDIIGSVTVYDVVKNRRLGFAMDLTGKVKIATADEDKGLGTGENDYSIQADFFKFAEQLTLSGSIGYKFRGDPSGVDLDNVLMASVGSAYKFTPDVKGGLFFDFRESSIVGSESIRELTGFVSRNVSEDWRLQLFVLAGFTDSSPDWGAGFQIKRLR